MGPFNSALIYTEEKNSPIQKCVILLFVALPIFDSFIEAVAEGRTSGDPRYSELFGTG